MSLRKAINAKCKECAHDPLDKGSAAQQIACCISTDCDLHAVRPVTCKSIPQTLLDHWHLTAEDLCERARPLVEAQPSCSVEGQIDGLPDVKPNVEGEILPEETSS
jgi:hypothetical protein